MCRASSFTVLAHPHCQTFIEAAVTACTADTLTVECQKLRIEALIPCSPTHSYPPGSSRRIGT